MTGGNPVIKVFLVDDEAIARINLRHMIDWEKEGFSVCGEAENGFDALEKAGELKPDIIFTDMNMAGMDGVEFITKVRKLLPSARIIAFSAFDDFEYVRQSLKEGALDYLVKHRLDAGSLRAILDSVRESIRNEYMELQRYHKAMTMASSGKLLMKRDFLRKLLNGCIRDGFEEKLEEYDVRLDDKNLVVAAARIDDCYQLKEKYSAQEFIVFMETVENILSNLCMETGRAEYACLEDGRFAFILSFAGIASEALIHSDTVAAVSNFGATVKRFLNITMSFGISDICPSMAGIGEFYLEACSALENGYYKGSGYIARRNELPEDGDAGVINGLSAMDEKSIISNIRSMRKDGVTELLDAIFKSIRDKKASYSSMKMVSVEIMNLLERMIRELSVPASLVYGSSVNLYEDMARFRTIDELGAWFKRLFIALIDAHEKVYAGKRYSPTVEKVIDYILRNYDRDISLSDVSGQVNVSPQYLSKLFKDECGKGFVNYLNGVRIEQARTMLAEGVKIRDLAEKTGFNNYTYFFTVFKEMTGMTPQQYEKQIKER